LSIAVEGEFVPAWFDNIPQFDELYSVSDLHMGGLGPGAQIFNSGKELAALIDHLRARPGKIVLVINGDMVDFLAEPDAKAFDPDGANQKLARIAADPSFVPVWAALARFAGTKEHRLVVTLGNHDLELALPWVREHFLSLLSAGDDAARGRITLAFDGAGFLCRVGNASVLCVHGNEVDDWNITDHETIRRAGRDLQQGRSVEAWVPNAGTHLVIEAMNDIKKAYPFVDLLKPEQQGVVPILLSIAPEKRDKINNAWPILKRLAQDKLRRWTGLLGEQDEIDGIAPGPRPQWRPPMKHDALMKEADDLLTKHVDPVSLVPPAQGGQQLGATDAAWSWIRGGDPRETLRRALEDLQNDRSFDWRTEDATFRDLDDVVMSGVDFILCGHTHLERALPRRKRRGFYLNSGTWVRLIKLEGAALADQAEFNKIYGALAAGTMDALDGLDGLVLHNRTVVAVRPAGAGVRGELLHWKSGELKPVHADAGMTRT
jgi:UDP-2,3-diacylglucosamine pyrophosphatase LpxH